MPTAPIVPAVPPVPAADAPADAWIHYRWAVTEVNRVACAEAQQAVVQAMNTPAPYDRRAELLRVAAMLPQVTGLTELKAVDLAMNLIAAVDKRIPPSA